MTYSKDLIFRARYYRTKMNLSVRKIANILLISKSTVHRWINKTNENKNSDKVNKNIDILTFLKRSLTRNPFQTLKLLKNKVQKKFNISRSEKTISNYLKIIKFKRKRAQRKLYSSTLKQHKHERKQFMVKIKQIDKNNIICVDESFINGSLYKKYGWSKKEKKLIFYEKRKHIPPKYSLIMAINMDGILKYNLYKNKSINAELFGLFLENLLTNVHNKYILMDNVRFHKSKYIQSIVEKNGNQIIFIPPYSPDFNPIEEVFSEMKSFIRSNISFKNFTKNIHSLLKRFSKKTTDLKNYYRHAFGT